MDNRKPVVVGIGELLWDMLPTGKRVGGAPANFVFHASQMGAEGYAISAVGNDDSGKEILKELEKNRIGHCISTVDYPTGKVLVELKDGIPAYTIIENVAWDHIPLTQEAIDIVRKADAVCYGTLSLRATDSRNTVRTLLRHARKEALRFFDINIRQHYYSKEMIEELLQYASVLKINDEELDLLRPMFGLDRDTAAACRWFIRTYNLDYVVLTGGAEFSSIYTPGEVSTLPTPRVTVADTVGAGDSFSGAFVCSVLSGKSLQEAHRIAVDTAAFVCTREGAWPEYTGKE